MTTEEIRRNLGTSAASYGITLGTLADALEQQAEPGSLDEGEEAELYDIVLLLRAGTAQLTRFAVAVKYPASPASPEKK